jgi:ABC-type lipoprotein release transport system permease subunit
VNFSFLIAIRYFLSKKRGNFVHLASWASIIGVAIGTAALILVLSVFNGFEKLILDMYNSFDPHIKITSACGKAFDPVGIKINSPDVIEKSYVLEEQVLLRYQDRQVFATVKGVSTSFKRLTNFDSLLVQGNYFDHSESENLAVIGRGIAHRLSLSLDNKFEKLHVYLPNRSATTLLNSSTAFRQSFVIPTGVFSVQSEINEKYIITPLSFIQNLADRDRGVSSIELKLVNNDRTSQLQKKN